MPTPTKKKAKLDSLVCMCVQVVERLQAFLGVTPGPVRSLQVPIHTQALQHHVANWEEVKSTLAGTAYEPMLYDQFSLTSTHTL